MSEVQGANEAIEGVEGRYWHALADGRIQCDVCPRACKLHEGQRGLCFVRGAQGGAHRADELRPLLRLLHRSHREEAAQPLPARHAGALLRHRRLQPRLPVLPELGHLQVARDRHAWPTRPRPRRSPRAAAALGCRSVAFTYNDPVIFPEYAIDMAEACRARGIKTVAVTAGYQCPEPRAEFYRHMDAANVDLKAFTEEFYKRICSGELAAVLDTLVYLKRETKVWFEITTLMIPGENDFARRDRGDVPLDRRQARPGRAAALHRLPPRLQDARPSAHPAGDPRARAQHRPRLRAALRLHRQRARSRRGRAPTAMPAASC